jgi:hypothetical protein
MKFFGVLLAFTLSILTVILLAQTSVPAGSVSGMWGINGSPYLIMGEIIVPADQTLTIEPGAEIVFQGHYKFIVEGLLLAAGTESDSIKFTVGDTTGFYNNNIPDGGWHGIRFINYTSRSDSSIVRYCSFTFGKAVGISETDQNGGAIYAGNYSRLVISNNSFRNCFATGTGGAVAVQSSNVSICRNVFRKNKADDSGGAVAISDNSDGEITANIMACCEAEYGGALHLETDCDPLIRNNLIYGNVACEKGGGIEVKNNCQATFMNNTFTGNSAGFGGAVDCEHFSSPVFHNDIIWNNTALSDGDQIHLSSEDSDPDFYYCDIQDGMDGIGTWNDGVAYDYTGIYEQNTNINPGFVDPENDIFLLGYKSPCIDDGDPDESYNDIENPDVPGFALWPSKGTVRNDMGAYGGPGVYYFPVINGIDESEIKRTTKQPCFLYQNFPNPVKDKTCIRYQLFTSGHVVLSVYDLTGRKLKNLADLQQSQGIYRVVIDKNKYNLRKGLYIYSLKVDNSMISRRMIVY